MSDQAIPATLLALTSSVGVYTSLLPPLSDVRRETNVHSSTIAQDVRMGEIAAACLVVAIGLMASSLTKNRLPAMAAIVAALGMTAMYESVLRATPREAK